jgi:hypothetical protein
VIRARHLEQVLVDLGEVDELLAAAFDVGADDLQDRAGRSGSGCRSPSRRCGGIVLVDRHVGRTCRTGCPAGGPDSCSAAGRPRHWNCPMSSAVILSFELSPHLIVRLARPGQHVLVGDILAHSCRARGPRLRDHFAVAVVLQVRERDPEVDVVVDDRRRERELLVVLAVIATGHRGRQRGRPVDVAASRT